jgi:ABC-2 type transport system ATP-binding protein
LRGLLALPVTDVAVEEAGLDEAFLTFYRQAEAEAQARRPTGPALGAGLPTNPRQGDEHS